MAWTILCAANREAWLANDFVHARLQQVPGAFEFTLIGPPGVYNIFGSTDLRVWTELGTLINVLGATVFTDLTVKNSLQNFYRARTAP